MASALGEVTAADKLYQCDICKEKFSQPVNLATHKALHCMGSADCPKDICSTENRDIAIAAEETTDKVHECSISMEKFSTPDGLSNHKAIHSMDTDPVRPENILSTGNSVTLVREETTDKVYQCVDCKKIFSKPSDLATHEALRSTETSAGCPEDASPSDSDKRYECEIGGLKFSQGKRLDDGEKTHSEDKPFECDVCQKRCKTKGNLTRHKQTHDNNFSCGVCKKSFRILSRLKRHEKLHTGLKPYACDVCQKRFSVAGNLVRHKITHTGVKPFECHVCQKRFSQKGDLGRHLLLHTGEKPHECSVCKKRFTLSSYLATHMRIHTGIKPFECDVCGKKFTQKSSLVKHNQIHHRNLDQDDLSGMSYNARTQKTPQSEASYECDLCHKKIVNKHNLELHKRTHTGEKPFSCNICHKSFSLPTNLARHKLEVHEREKRYECDVCLKRFSQKIGLFYHKLIHTGEKPYECHICKKRFCHPATLARHKRTHFKDFPYECQVCAKKFSNSTDLEKHTAKKHCFECSICKERLTRSTDLEMHKALHLATQIMSDASASQLSSSGSVEIAGDKQINDFFECDVCRAKFPRTSDLENHKAQHLNTETMFSDSAELFSLPDNFHDPHYEQADSIPSSYECDICKEKFAEYTDLQRHITLHRATSSAYVITSSTCPRSFSSDQTDSLELAEEAAILEAEPDHSEVISSTEEGKTIDKIYSVCIEAFVQPADVINHEGLHSSETGHDCSEEIPLPVTDITLVEGETENKLYECDLCNERLPDQETYNRHKDLHSKENGKDCCDGDSLTETALTGGRSAESPGKIYKCDVCTMTFSQVEQVDDHKKTHPTDKPYECNVCKKACKTQANLTRHKQTHDSYFECDVCKRGFRVLSRLKKHEKIHTGLKPYECDVCQKRFSIAGNLARHKRTHTGEKPFQCGICQKTFSQKADMGRHERLHRGEKPHACGMCERKFTHSGNLTKHMKTHNGLKAPKRAHSAGKPYKCDVCHKIFSQYGNLARHKMQVHDGERPHQCDVCQKRFCQATDLERHKRIHTGEKRYECDICKKRFCHPASLPKHRRTHFKDNLQYECDVCKQRFSRPSELEVHKRAHNEANYDCVVLQEAITTIGQLSDIF